MSALATMLLVLSLDRRSAKGVLTERTARLDVNCSVITVSPTSHEETTEEDTGSLMSVAAFRTAQKERVKNHNPYCMESRLLNLL